MISDISNFCPEESSSAGQSLSATRHESRGSELPPPAVFLSERKPDPTAFSSERAARAESTWRATLEAYNAIVSRARLDGHAVPSYPQAAAILGVPTPTLWRIVNQYAGRDLKASFDNCGQRSPFESVLQSVAFCEKLTELYLATLGGSSDEMLSRAARTGRRTGKAAVALTLMAEESECPAPLAAVLRAGKFPMFLRKFLKRITPEVEQKLRGSKHFQLNGMVSRRDLTVRFPDGTRGDLPAGFKWVFDDMSVNQPFWTTVDGRLLFSRQGLYAIDQRSLRWLGNMLVARPREAYRSEDILRFLRGLFLAYGGKPDVIVFEQGVWKARKIHGFRITSLGDPAPDEFERPGMAEEDQHLLTDGLAAIGIKVIFAISAHGKIIETCFNPLQTYIAVKARNYVNIGRHAGEFEIAGKRLAQVRAGSRAPGAVGFAPALELNNCIEAALNFHNGRQNSRGEIPDEIWARDLAARPLQENRSVDAAVFLPEIRSREIRGGCVSLTVAGEQHDFRADWMVELGSGYKVHVRFDPAEPTLGAAIYNRETGSDNINGWKPNQFIGFAQWEMPAPSLNVEHGTRGIAARDVTDYYGTGAIDQGNEVRKRQEKLVATFANYLPRPGLPAVKSNEARDGSGKIVRVENGAPMDRREIPAVTVERNRTEARLQNQRQLADYADDALANLKD